MAILYLVLGELKNIYCLGIKTLLLYLFTTALAITIALAVASLLHVGSGAQLPMGVTGIPHLYYAAIGHTITHKYQMRI